MHKNINLFVCFALPLLFGLYSGCKNAGGNNDIGNGFPDAQSISTLKSTNFVATISDSLPAQTNIIYCPTFLFAWSKLTDKLGGKLISDKPCQLLTNINSKHEFEKSLDKNEYSINIEIHDQQIKINSSFRKSLPYRTPFEHETDRLTFNDKLVKSFGMSEFDEDIARQIYILYYENDNKFIVGLKPKDNEHEILVAKGYNGEKKLNNIIRNIQTDISIGDSQRKEDPFNWRYIIKNSDKLFIPVISFNLEKEYDELLRREFHINDKYYFIKQASQRTAFIFNDSGAKVESVAEVVGAAAAAPPPDDVQVEKPKMLVCDKPFTIMLRKRSVEQPYLMVKIENTELMQTQSGK